jgi:excisionase family DNA binding protein
MTAEQESRLNVKAVTKDHADLPPRLLTASQVAEVLQISKSMAYQMIARREIPSIRIGRSVRVRPIDLNAFIEAQVCTTNGAHLIGGLR